MAALSTQKITTAGIAVTTANAGATGDTFNNSGAQKIYVDNTTAGEISITVASPGPCSFGCIITGGANTHDLVVPVPAGAKRYIGPFNVARFNNPTDGTVKFTSSVTGATVQVAVIE